MAQMRAEIIYNRTVTMSRELEQRIRANTVIHDSENVESNQEGPSESYEISPEVIEISDENEETTVSDSCEYDVNANPDADNAWSTVLNNWLEDLAAEYDEDFVSESLDLSERLNHPADDPIAKWSLADLFVVELPAPSAINNLQLVYNME